jgi:hypothetical protein
MAKGGGYLMKKVIVIAGAAGTLLIIGIVMVLMRTVFAQVQVVTVPLRSTVQLTIYSDKDLTFTKEQRKITLRKGTNVIQFSWEGTLIDPTSIQIKAMEHPQNIDIKEAIFPPNLDKAILWEVDSSDAVEETFEVSYFISGLTWTADYTGIVKKDGSSMSLTGAVIINNNSGESFDDAQTRLVVGEIYLVEGISELAEIDRFERARAMEQYAAEPKISESTRPASEYYMYTLQGVNTIGDKWQRRLNYFSVADIPLNVVYRLEPGASQAVRLYQFANDTQHNLGKQPLPAGAIRIFMQDEAGDMSFVGQDKIDFVPVGKEIKLNLGPDLEVEVEKKLMDYARINLEFNEDNELAFFDTEEEFKLEPRNYKDTQIKLELLEHIAGQWELLSSSYDYEKKDVNTIQFTIDLAAGSKQTITYRVRHLGR